MIGKTIDELRLGDAAEFAKTVSESDIYLYAGVTGDFNPAHVNEVYTEKTFLKTRIASEHYHFSSVEGPSLKSPLNPLIRSWNSWLCFSTRS